MNPDRCCLCRGTLTHVGHLVSYLHRYQCDCCNTPQTLPRKPRRRELDEIQRELHISKQLEDGDGRQEVRP